MDIADRRVSRSGRRWWPWGAGAQGTQAIEPLDTFKCLRWIEPNRWEILGEPDRYSSIAIFDTPMIGRVRCPTKGMFSGKL